MDKIVQKQGLYIYLSDLKHVKQVRKFGHIIYTHPMDQYVLLYTEARRLNKTLEKLDQLKCVKQVLLSQYKEIPTTYEKEDYEKGDFKF